MTSTAPLLRRRDRSRPRPPRYNPLIRPSTTRALEARRAASPARGKGSGRRRHRTDRHRSDPARTRCSRASTVGCSLRAVLVQPPACRSFRFLNGSADSAPATRPFSPRRNGPRGALGIRRWPFPARKGGPSRTAAVGSFGGLPLSTTQPRTGYAAVAGRESPSRRPRHPPAPAPAHAAGRWARAEPSP